MRGKSDGRQQGVVGDTYEGRGYKTCFKSTKQKAQRNECSAILRRSMSHAYCSPRDHHASDPILRAKASADGRREWLERDESYRQYRNRVCDIVLGDVGILYHV
jgi:hypothetical protein